MGRHTLSGLSWWSCRAHWPCRTPRYKVIYFMGRYTISVLSSVVVRAHRPCRTPQYKGHLFHEAAHVISVITFHGATHVISVIIFHGAAHVIGVIMVVRTHRPCRPPQYIYPMGHDTCRSGQGSLAVTYATVHSPHGDVTRVTVAVTYATVHSYHGDYPVYTYPMETVQVHRWP